MRQGLGWRRRGAIWGYKAQRTAHALAEELAANLAPEHLGE